MTYRFLIHRENHIDSMSLLISFQNHLRYHHFDHVLQTCCHHSFKQRCRDLLTKLKLLLRRSFFHLGSLSCKFCQRHFYCVMLSIVLKVFISGTLCLSWQYANRQDCRFYHCWHIIWYCINRNRHLVPVIEV